MSPPQSLSPSIPFIRIFIHTHQTLNRRFTNILHHPSAINPKSLNLIISVCAILYALSVMTMLYYLLD
ncbi:hypothetical protein QVD17_28170 [Tagetes erecta]|uniref:Uncharacterized protein n=1 Tax=Tagetes erecta TaxID=13708 RepID=A0AAD8NRU6_TARER|nr:hypothetical protein QVD17_28170 [Tagetes erecta]